MSDAPDIEALFEDGRAIDAALAKAVREAVLQHKQAGNPVAVWRDGQVVWISADAIVVDQSPMEPLPGAESEHPTD
jgi:hypothetical protein